MEAKVVYRKDVQEKDLGGGVYRSVLAYNKDMMVVEMRLEKGGKVPEHSHPHVQSSCVRSGRFCFTIAGEPVEVAEGDTIAFPSGVKHSVECLESGALTEIFAPMREDFI